ncbi:MAG: hypothetical protein WAQ28_02075 [Bacteroidia bacterium]
MFEKAFIEAFKKESGLQQLTEVLQGLITKVEDLTHSTDIKTYSLKQAQDVCGIDWQALRRACITNELKHFKNGTKYQVTHGSLREYLDKKMNETNPLRKVG